MTNCCSLPKELWQAIAYNLDLKSIQSLQRVNKTIFNKLVQPLLIAKIKNLHHKALIWAKNFNEYSEVPFDNYVKEFQIDPALDLIQDINYLNDKLKTMKAALVRGGAYVQISQISTRAMPMIKRFESIHAIHMKQHCLNLGLEDNTFPESLVVQMSLHDIDNSEKAWRKYDLIQEKCVSTTTQFSTPLPCIFPLSLFKQIKEEDCVAIPIRKKLVVLTCRQKGTQGDALGIFESAIDPNKFQAANVQNMSYHIQANTLTCSSEGIYFAPKDNL